MFEPVDFEHPTQRATSSALLIKVPGAWLDTGRLNSFEPDFIFASLPSIDQRTLPPVSFFFTPPETVWGDLFNRPVRGPVRSVALNHQA
jgi:hypothetical protein